MSIDTPNNSIKNINNKQKIIVNKWIPSREKTTPNIDLAKELEEVEKNFIKIHKWELDLNIDSLDIKKSTVIPGWYIVNLNNKLNNSPEFIIDYYGRIIFRFWNLNQQPKFNKIALDDKTKILTEYIYVRERLQKLLKQKWLNEWIKLSDLSNLIKDSHLRNNYSLILKNNKLSDLSNYIKNNLKDNSLKEIIILLIKRNKLNNELYKLEHGTYPDSD